MRGMVGSEEMEGVSPSLQAKKLILCFSLFNNKNYIRFKHKSEKLKTKRSFIKLISIVGILVGLHEIELVDLIFYFIQILSNVYTLFRFPIDFLLAHLHFKIRQLIILIHNVFGQILPNLCFFLVSARSHVCFCFIGEFFVKLYNDVFFLRRVNSITGVQPLFLFCFLSLRLCLIFIFYYFGILLFLLIQILFIILCLISLTHLIFVELAVFVLVVFIPALFELGKENRFLV